jgi:hypothetical protein
MLAGRLESIAAVEAKARQVAPLMRGTQKPVVANLPQREPKPADETKARAEAARAVNVSPRSVQDAKTVLTRGTPALVAAVDKGRVAVSTAAAVASAPRAPSTSFLFLYVTLVEGASDEAHNAPRKKTTPGTPPRQSGRRWPRALAHVDSC